MAENEVYRKLIGPGSAYAFAKEGGYTGTKEEYETLMASYGTVAEQAAQSARRAEEAAASITTDDTLSIAGKAADAKKTGDEISAIKDDLTLLENEVDTKATQTALNTEASVRESADTNLNDILVHKPVSSPNGLEGQILRSLGNGNTEWSTFGQPTYAQIQSAISEYLTAHPEAIQNVLVTPEDYGAIGDGITDDTTAIQTAIDSNPNTTIVFRNKYLVSQPILTPAGDDKKVFLQFLEGAELIADANFVGDAVLIIGGSGTRTRVQDTTFVTGCDGISINTNGITDGIHVTCVQCPRLTNITIKNVVTTGIVIDTPDSDNDVTSSDAYVDNVFITGKDSNNVYSTGMLVKGHDNDIRNVRIHWTNIGINVTGSHNRISNVHPVRSASDQELEAYNESVAFRVGNNNIYLDNCYSDNFATGISVDMPGAIFFVTNFTLLWWESLDTVKSFIKLRDNGDDLAANKLFWGHVSGADLLYFNIGTNYGINGNFHENTYFRNPDCFSGIYANMYISPTDALLDKRLTVNKIKDFNYFMETDQINSLDSIKQGTTGRVRVTPEISPLGIDSVFVFNCAGDSTRRQLTFVDPVSNDTYINALGTDGWSGWTSLQRNAGVNVTDFITDLDQIRYGEMGRKQFAAVVSPINSDGVFIYECLGGDETRKILRAYDPATKYNYINSKGANGWTGWERLYTNQTVVPISPTPLTSLDDILVGTSGRIILASSISPNGLEWGYVYICIGDSSRKSLTLIEPNDHIIYYNTYGSSGWKGWQNPQINAGVNVTDFITDLSTIRCGEMGRKQFAAAVSPINSAGVFIYECIGGDETRKILKAYNPANKAQYINSLGSSGWTGWTAL